MDAAEVEVADEDLEAVVVVHGVLVEAVIQEIEAEDSTALPVLARMIAATNGPEAVAVGSQHLKN